jgi:hypothetical protein
MEFGGSGVNDKHKCLQDGCLLCGNVQIQCNPAETKFKGTLDPMAGIPEANGNTGRAKEVVPRNKKTISE